MRSAVLRAALLPAALLLAATASGAGGLAPPITALALHPGGREVVAASPRRLALHELRTGKLLREASLPLARVTALAFTADGAGLLVAGGQPGSKGEVLRLAWPAARVEARWTLGSDLPGGVVLPTAGWVAGGADGRLRHLPGGGPLREQAGHTGAIHAVAASPGGEVLVTGGEDRTVRVWSADLAPLHTLGNHTGPVLCAAFRPDAPQPTCATGSEDGTVRVWQPQIGRMVRIVRGHQGSVLAVAWSRDRLYSAGADGTVREFAADSDRELRRWQRPDWVYALAVTPDGEVFAAGAEGLLLRIAAAPRGTP